MLYRIEVVLCMVLAYLTICDVQTYDYEEDTYHNNYAASLNNADDDPESHYMCEPNCCSNCCGKRDHCDWGGWNVWGPWSSCTMTCGGGSQTRCRKRCRCCHPRKDETCSDCSDGDFTEYEDQMCNYGDDLCFEGSWNPGQEECDCNVDHYGYCCNNPCPLSEYCKYAECTESYNSMCVECEDTASPDVQAYHLESGLCTPKCNWLGHNCYPGICDTGQDYLYNTCECIDGFVLDTPNQYTSRCLLDHYPDIPTCRLGAESALGEAANSTFTGNLTSCDNTEDAFVNFPIDHMFFEYSFSFMLPQDPPKDEPEKHVYVDSYHFGITSARDTVTYYNKDGITDEIRVVILDNHPTALCSVQNFTIDTPWAGMITCRLNDDYGGLINMNDGEKICHEFDVTASGFVDIQDMMNTDHASVRNYHNSLKFNEQKCFHMDQTSPDHCVNSPGSCTDDVLNFGNRIRRDNNLVVTFDGWFDPEPNSVVSWASGMKEYEVEIKDVQHAGTELYADFSIIHTYISNGSDVEVVLPDYGNPAMFAIYLSALDSTQESPNYKIARRFVLADNTSVVETNRLNPIYVTSASSETDLEWQVQLTAVKLEWVKHFHNSWHVHTNWLLPIRPEGNLSISGPFEQETGELPVSGTPNLDGIVNFKYTFHRISVEGEQKPNFTDVPNAFNERLTLTEFQPLDGDIVEVTIKAIDIMNNTLDDSVTVKIDSSPPKITDMYLMKDGYRQLFVHNSTGLAQMNMTFSAYDPHSGLKTVFWRLGTEEGSADIGTGALPVVKIQNNTHCDEYCYCPMLGSCQMYSFVIPLHGLIANDTDTGDHNRHYHFMFTVMNDAHLETVDKVDILVDSTPPEVGHVFDGPVGNKDRDFQSEPTLHWHWQGFIDHESGISKYHIAAGKNRCFTTDELQHLHNIDIDDDNNNITDMEYFTETLSTFASYEVGEPGFYRLTVIAFNGAMEPSEAVCSSGVVYDETAPLLQNITVIGAVHQKAIICNHDTSIWFLNSKGFIRPLHPMAETCSERCEDNTTSLSTEGRFPQEEMQNGTFSPTYSYEESLEICNLYQLYSHESEALPVFIVNEHVEMRWDVLEDESEMLDYYVGLASNPQSVDRPDIKGFESAHNRTHYSCIHCGVGQGDQFYISLKGTNKASLFEVLPIGPVIVDMTPPQFIGGIQVHVTGADSEDIYVTWEFESFWDPDWDEVLHDYAWAIGTRRNKQEVIPWTAHAFEYNYTSQAETFVISFPKHILQQHDQDQGKEYVVSIKAYNKALLHTVGESEKFQIHSQIYPSSGVVLHVNDKGLEIGHQEDQNIMCIKWFGFNHHSQELNISIGLGSQAGKDDILLSFPTTEKDTICIDNLELATGKEYFALVTAHNQQGLIKATSKGVYVAFENEILQDSVVNIGGTCPNKFDFIIGKNINATQSKFNVSIPRTSQPYLSLRIDMSSFNISSKANVIVKFDGSILPLHTWNAYGSGLWLFYNIIQITENFTMSVEVAAGVNSFINEVALHRCTASDDIQISSSPHHLDWSLNNPHRLFVTNYEIRICKYGDDPQLCGTTNDVYSNNQPIVIQDAGNNTQMTLDSYLEHRSSYSVCIKPCFKSTCLNQSVCEDFTVDILPPKHSKIEAYLDADENKGVLDTNVYHIRAVWDVFYQYHHSGYKAVITYDWTISLDEFGSSPLMEWTRITVNQSAPQVEVNQSVYIHVHKFKSMYFTIRAVGSTGVPSIVSVELEMRDLEPSSGAQVFDLPRDYDIDRLRDYLHSTNLGELNSELHNNDMDFTREDSVVCGAVLGCDCGSYTWSLQTSDATKCENSDTDTKLYEGCLEIKQTTDNVVKFTRFPLLHYATNYTVCVASGGRCTPFRTCSNGFVVDSKAPTVGMVTLGIDNEKVWRDASTAVISWTAFTDIEEDIDIPFPYGISNYQVSLGSAPGEVDIVTNKYMGLSDFAYLTNLTLLHGKAYYATVKACDHVGLCTSAVSSQLLVDSTPPVIGSVKILHNNIMYNESDFLIISWENIDDPDTGIQSVELAIGTSPYSQDVYPYMPVEDTYRLINVQGLIDGQIYYAHLKATNRVHLWTLQASQPLLYDSSPPEVGYVRHGLSAENPYTFTTDDSQIKAHWAGFADSHTGLFFYRLAVGTQAGEADVVHWKDMGTKKEFETSVTLIQGQPYYVTIEACNGVLLCSRSVSGGVIADSSAPVGGVVHVRHSEEHEDYHYSSNSLPMKWFGFHDPQSDIAEYKWCISTTSINSRNNSNCDVHPLTSAHQSNEVHPAELQLPLHTKLIVTLVATNRVGLEVSVNSRVFIVDKTAPVVVSDIRVNTAASNSLQEHTQFDRSFISVEWEMIDQESPVLSYEISILSHQDGVTPLAGYLVGNVKAATIPLALDQQLRDGNHYQVKVTGCNAASLCTTSVTASDFLVDSSPPLAGGFIEPMYWRKDTPGTILTLSWEGFVDPHSAVEKYYIIVSTAYNGFDLSDGVRLVEGNTTTRDDNRKTDYELVLYDKEISVDDLIYITIWAENGVGLLTNAAKISLFVLPQDKEGSSNGKVLLMQQQHKSGILKIEKHSCDVEYCNYDCTCAIVDGYCVPDGVRHSCTELNNTSELYSGVDVLDGLYGQSHVITASSVCLPGYWVSHFMPEELTRFEWSVSMTGHDPGFGVIDVLNEKYLFDVETYDRAVYCAQGNFTFLQGEKYSYHINAWHDFYEYSHYTSLGVIIDTTPPSIGLGRHIQDMDSTMQYEVDFTSDISGVYAYWDNVFSDIESGINLYVVSIGTSQGGNELYGPSNMSLSTNISHKETTLQPGLKYYTTVSAYNTLGMVQVAYSAGFIVDISPPDTGVVFTGASYRDRRFSSGNDLLVSWLGFSDQHSFIREYQYVFAEEGTPSWKLEFTPVHLQNEVLIEAVGLENGKSYEAFVKAIDAAGHTSETMKSSVITIDKTNPIFIRCKPQPNSNGTSNDTVYSGIMDCKCEPITEYHSVIHCSCGLPDTAAILVESGEMYKIEVFADNSAEDARIKLEFGDYTEWVLLQRERWNRYIHTSYYIADTNANISPLIYTNKPLPTDIIFTISKCESIIVDSDVACESCTAISIKQWQKNILYINIPAFDPESGIHDIQLGIGTNKGGYQLLPYTSIGRALSVVMPLKLQHRMDVWVNLLVENNAGGRVNRTYGKLLIDWTPPVISDLQPIVDMSLSKIGLDFIMTGPRTNMYNYMETISGINFQVSVKVHDISNISIQAQWSITEEESNISDCLWTIGYSPKIEDILLWEETTDIFKAQSPILEVGHGDLIFITVLCHNTLGMHSEIISQTVISTKSPDSITATVQINPQTSSHYEPRGKSQVCDNVVEFDVSGFYDATGVWFYEYKISTALDGPGQWVNGSKQEYFLLDDVSLQQGSENKISVRAVNNNGLTSDAVENTVTVNMDIPQLTGKGLEWHFQDVVLTVYWPDVFQWSSGELFYEVYLGTRPGATDLQMAHFTNTTQTSVSSKKLNTPMTCYCVVTAIAPTGNHIVYQENFNI